MAAAITSSPSVTTATTVNDTTATTPTTPTNEILKGVVAVVDVRYGYDNRSDAVASQLRRLGAIVLRHFNKQVTHVIFDEGRKSLYNKAKENGTHLLSVLWIDGCIREGKRVSEECFPAFIDESYENPLIKRKVFRSLQPMDFEEGLAKTAALLQRRLRRRERIQYRRQLLSSDTTASETSQSPLNSNNSWRPTRDAYCGLLIYDSSSEDEEHAGVVPPPLARRLLNKFPDSPVLLEAYKRRELKHSNLKDRIRTRDNNDSERIENAKVDVGDDSENNETRKESETGAGSKCGNKRTRAKAFSTSESEMEEKFNGMQLSADWICHGRPSIEEFKIKKPKAKRLSFSFESSTSTGDRSNEPIPDLPTMVLTSFNPGERETIVSMIKKLGKFCISGTVETLTTHIICGNVRRTLSVLYGTVRGCWLLSSEWVFKSYAVGKWIEEEPYELFENFPTAQICRLEKMLSPSPYRCNIFSDVGPIFVSSSTTIPAKDLRELLSLAGAKVVNCHRLASVIIGQEFGRLEANVTCVSEHWALNSIGKNTSLPLNEFKFNNI